MVYPNDLRTPEERSRHARDAADKRWSKTVDFEGATLAARRAFDQRFFSQTDPNLPDDVRQKQADKLRVLHFRDLAKRSAAARKARREDF